MPQLSPMLSVLIFMVSVSSFLFLFCGLAKKAPLISKKI